MDLTDFSLLVGLVVGYPIANVVLQFAFPWLPWWAGALAAFPLGLLPVAVATFATVAYLASRQDRRTSEREDA